MKHLRVKLLPFVIAVSGCADEPTAVVRPLNSAPRFVLVNGSVTPIDGGLVTSPIVTIAQNRGPFTYPSVSGDLMCYTDAVDQYTSQVRYFSFATGLTHATAPATVDVRDDVCDLAGSRIVFARANLIDAFRKIMMFDASDASLTELAPAPADRFLSAIGGNIVAIGENYPDHSDVRVVDLATPNQSLQISPTEPHVTNSWPRVSPDGNRIVWGRCSGSSCEIRKSLRTGETWGAPETVAQTGEFSALADTDGSYIAYAAKGSSNDLDIHIQAVGGGPVTQLAIPGQQGNPRMSAGAIAFGSVVPPNALSDVFVYVIAANTLYRITNTGTTGLHDVSVLPNGDIRVVWSVYTFTIDPFVQDVLGTTFTPASVPTFSFGGFLAPVQGPPTVNIAKAGGAIPVKFSLGGDRGLSIFASSSPSSVTVTCDAGAPTGTVTETATAGNSVLSYDASSDTYSYVWKTDKGWANSCRRLTLRFIDGTITYADFQFTK